MEKTLGDGHGSGMGSKRKGSIGEEETLVSSWSESAYVSELRQRQARASALLGADRQVQERLGYFHTLQEILQQPWTWLDTGARMASQAEEIRELLRNVRSITLTGSGSSEYAGDCVRQALQSALGVAVQVVGGGNLLMYGLDAFPSQRPSLLISLARSGDSPESAASLSRLLAADASIRHLVLTCNREGKLARNLADVPQARAIVLSDRTNDRSLVMTSSFTNLVLASRFLGLLDCPQVYQDTCRYLGSIFCDTLLAHFDVLANLGEQRFQRVAFLGNGAKFGAARESALKMAEMTAGRIPAISENCLSLRHGPMSFISKDTLVVCFLSAQPTLRAYETDLLDELTRKQLGFAFLLVGENIPKGMPSSSTIAIETRAAGKLGDDNTMVIDVAIGQLLAFHRCLSEGLKPDLPSESGVIHRVVENFAIHDDK